MVHDTTYRFVEEADRMYKAQHDNEKYSGMRFLIDAGNKPGALEICFLEHHVEEEFRKLPSHERKGVGVRVAEMLLMQEYKVELDDYLAATKGGHEDIPAEWKEAIRQRVQFAQADADNGFNTTQRIQTSEPKPAPSYLVDPARNGCLF